MKHAIRVEGLSKRYRLGAQRTRSYRTLAETVAEGARSALDYVRRRPSRSESGRADFWALQDVSFDVHPGDTVGVIGRNGSGKSTLLKILSRITEPTSGRAVIRGRVASLLEVGTGFHPELSGRENIYLNGSILGMSRREIDRQFDAIVAFSEIEQFLDTPVKRYSSGMYVRLAFAVAAHLQPEILIVDEVLAVGDLAFQRKCLGKMGEVAKSGRTVLFVSHNMAAVGAHCNRAIWLQQGRIERVGAAGECLHDFVASMSGHANGESSGSLLAHPNRRPGCRPVIRSVRMMDSNGRRTGVFPMGTNMNVEVAFASESVLVDFHIGLGIDDAHGRRLMTFHTSFQENCELPTSAKSGVVTVSIPRLPLAAGMYYLSPAVGTSQRLVDLVDQAVSFEVLPRDVYGSGKVPNASQGPFFHAAKYSYRPNHVDVPSPAELDCRADGHADATGQRSVGCEYVREESLS